MNNRIELIRDQGLRTALYKLQEALCGKAAETPPTTVADNSIHERYRRSPQEIEAAKVLRDRIVPDP